MLEIIKDCENEFGTYYAEEGNHFYRNLFNFYKCIKQNIKKDENYLKNKDEL